MKLWKNLTKLFTVVLLTASASSQASYCEAQIKSAFNKLADKTNFESLEIQDSQHLRFKDVKHAIETTVEGTAKPKVTFEVSSKVFKKYRSYYKKGAFVSQVAELFNVETNEEAEEDFVKLSVFIVTADKKKCNKIKILKHTSLEFAQKW